MNVLNDRVKRKERIIMDTSLKKRVVWLDNVKLICIFFVMVSHLECTPRIFRLFFTPFFLTAFFFASGYVYKDTPSFKELIKKKARALLVPWFWFGLFNIVTSQILTFNAHASLKEEIIHNLLQVRGYGDRMWFIAALFVAHIPFYFLVKYCDRKKRVIISTIMFILSFVYSFYVDGNLFPWGTNNLPWHLEYIFVVNFFMVMGYEYKNSDENILKKFDTKLNKVLLLCIYLLLVVLNYYVGFTQSNIFIISTVMTIIMQVIGVALCVEAGKILPCNKFFSYVGMNTLIYYGLHGKVESIIEVVLRKVGIYGLLCDNAIIGIVGGILIVICVSVLLLIPTWIINRYLPFVTGKKRMKA